MPDVSTIIDQQIAHANNYLTQAQDFINAVATLAATQFSVPIPSGLAFGFTDYTQDAIDRITNLTPARPDAFGEISVLEPTSPVLSFLDIDQTLLDAVAEKLFGDLEDGGYGIEPADEARLFQRMRDREVQGAMTAVDEIMRQYAQTGFAMPGGPLFDATAKALQEMQGKVSAANREITLERSRLYFEARKNTIEQSKSVQEILINLHRAVTEHATVMTALYNAQISKYRADVEADVELIKSNVEIYSADIRAFVASVQAIAESYRLRVNEQALTQNWNVEVARTSIASASLQLESQKAEAVVQTNAAQFGAEYYKGVISAALGAIMTLTSQSASE